MKHLSAILALTIFLFVGLACSDSGDKTDSSDSRNVTSKGNESSTAETVGQITFKNANDESVTGFKTTDKVHKVSVKFNDTNLGKVKGVFTAVNAGGEKNFKIVEKEMEIGSLMNTANFTATIDSGFPAGDYKFDVYLNDKLLKTENYKVQ